MVAVILLTLRKSSVRITLSKGIRGLVSGNKKNFWSFSRNFKCVKRNLSVSPVLESSRHYVLYRNIEFLKQICLRDTRGGIN